MEPRGPRSHSQGLSNNYSLELYRCNYSYSQLLFEINYNIVLQCMRMSSQRSLFYRLAITIFKTFLPFIMAMYLISHQIKILFINKLYVDLKYRLPSCSKVHQHLKGVWHPVIRVSLFNSFYLTFFPPRARVLNDKAIISRFILIWTNILWGPVYAD